MTKNAQRLFMLFTLCLALGTAVPALAESPQIVGLWNSKSIQDGTGLEEPFLATFNRDGNWLATGAQAASGTAHGAWERKGPRTFSTTLTVFIYDSNGALAFTGVGKSELEVSLDGQTYSGVFESEILTLDGTVVGTSSGTVQGTRITVESD